jgi:hypothetical protein
LLEGQDIAPGAGSRYCYALPVLIPPVDARDLEFSIPVKFVAFQ